METNHLRAIRPLLVGYVIKLSFGKRLLNLNIILWKCFIWDICNMYLTF